MVSGQGALEGVVMPDSAFGLAGRCCSLVTPACGVGYCSGFCSLELKCGLIACPEPEPNLFRQLALALPAGEAWHHQIGDLNDRQALKDLVLTAQPEVITSCCTATRAA